MAKRKKRAVKRKPARRKQRRSKPGNRSKHVGIVIAVLIIAVVGLFYLKGQGEEEVPEEVVDQLQMEAAYLAGAQDISLEEAQDIVGEAWNFNFGAMKFTGISKLKLGSWSGNFHYQNPTGYGNSKLCRDTDGRNAFIRGVVTYKGRRYTDSCDNSTHVREHSCISNLYHKQESIGCPNRCSSGRCY